MRPRLQQVFREVFDDDTLVITPDTSYETLKGWDSMAQVKLIMALEEEFGIKLSTDEVVEATKLGVTGLVLKESSPETLLKCVRRVNRGEQWIDRDTVTHAFQAIVGREAATREVSQTLTPREIEIVKMMAEGLRNRAIGDRLGISEGTVKVHLHNVYEKLGLDGRLELMLYAQQKGII